MPDASEGSIKNKTHKHDTTRMIPLDCLRMFSYERLK